MCPQAHLWRTSSRLDILTALCKTGFRLWQPPSPLARVVGRPNLLSYLRRLRLRVASAAV